MKLLLAVLATSAVISVIYAAPYFEDEDESEVMIQVLNDLIDRFASEQEEGMEGILFLLFKFSCTFVYKVYS